MAILKQELPPKEIDQLYSAIEKRDNERVKNLLRDFPQLASMQHRDITPLHFAVVHKNPQAVALLLPLLDEQVNAYGNLIFGKNPKQLTALHFAAVKGYTEILSLLLTHPHINVTLKTMDELRSPVLNLAAMMSHYDAVELLLKHRDTDPTAVDSVDADALAAAVYAPKNSKKNTTIVLLLKILARREYDFSGLFLEFAELRDTEMFQLFIDHLPADVLNEIFLDHNRTLSLAHMLVYFGQHDYLKLLLKTGKIHLNPYELYFGQTILHQVVIQGDLTMLQLLLEHGIPTDATNRDGDTALQLAMKLPNSNSDIIAALSPSAPLHVLFSEVFSHPLPQLHLADRLIADVKQLPVSGAAPPASSPAAALASSSAAISAALQPPAPRPSKKTPASVTSFHQQWQAELARQKQKPASKAKQRVQDGKLEVMQREKSDRYAAGLPLDSKVIFHSAPRKEDFFARHYYYVPGHELEQQTGLPVYIHVTDETVAKAKAVGAWEKNEKHLREGSKSIAQQDENRMGIRELKQGGYKLALKDKQAGDARLFTRGEYRQEWVLGKDMLVLTLDRFAPTHDKLNKQVASNPAMH